MSLPFVATVIAAPPFSLSAAAGETIRHSLHAENFVWLENGKAVDFYLRALPSKEVIQELRAVHGAIDVIAQAAEGRQKRLFLADMEATIIANELLEDMAELMGAGGDARDITRRAMNGEMDFAAALRARLSLLRGMPESLLAQVAGGIRVEEGASTLLNTLRAKGVRNWLVTGGFTYFAERVAKALLFDEVRANRLKLSDDVLTGDVEPPILDRAGKRAALAEACALYHLSESEVLAVGDGANDLDMLLAVEAAGGLAIGYRPKAALAACLLNVLLHTDFTSLLYAQGYRPEEWRPVD